MEQADIQEIVQDLQNSEGVAKKKIFTYVRESKKDGSVNTFEAQITAIHAFMKRIGLSEYEEVPKKEGKSAFKEGRPQFNDMIDILTKDSKKGDKREYIGIVFFDVSRMARNSADFLKIEEVIGAGYKIYSVSENIIDSPAWKYFFRMIQMESIYYSDRQSSKSQRYNLTILCKNAYTHTGWGGITYGYNKGWTKPPLITIHPVNSLIVKEIFLLAQQQKPYCEIEQIIQDKFEKIVQNYNQKSFGIKTISEQIDNDDIDDDEKDIEKFIAMEEGEEVIENNQSIKASLPKKKQISDILLWKGRIQYNGFRRYKLKVSFEEDISLFTSIIMGQENGWRTPFILWEDYVLRKGDQILTLDVREKLVIIENDLYQAVTGKFRREVDETMKHIQIYKWLLWCSCGQPIVGKLEAKNRMYYWCRSIYQKVDLKNPAKCHRWTKITEEAIDRIFEQEILKKIYCGYLMYDREGLWKWLHSKRITDMTKRLNSLNSALTIFKKKLISWEWNEIYLKQIEKKAAVILELEDKKAEHIKKAQEEELYIFEKIQNYLYEPKDMKQTIAELILNEMILDEPHDWKTSIYNNPKNTRHTTLYKKKIMGCKLNPYFNMLHVLGDLYTKEVE